ncbi:amino acid permease [Leptospira bandrabouensis]|uniref:Amino acid permease n=1 Tax=Leptospira bandrabouensis TaxID=2484903 RepID=A0A6H3NSV9_9LEPT|nr:amino acid permease [Leptospira bandrabouensis]MCG6144794.1 amino acid permease [Leptospira bandrabouensis]MCG6160569.1 amino acid permease [Leptospira bandrabouensis]MCG6164501.1 amino acid permease [Leptospira bandrabouensis]MCW7458969.1 amino acid permease [Leptospira bandrabouensis]MCW7478037.1 amino acid permease [Leptospira bandrabouensis]
MNQKSMDQDTAQLEALGLRSEFDRSMSFWENFSLGFTYLSPVVGVYSVFALAIQAGGPPMIWNYLLVGFGQFLVCLVFGEIVSQYPISGGIYPWSLRLVGERWAWMSAWVYAWALFTTVAAVSVGGAPFLSQLIGIEFGNSGFIWIAILMILISTILNLSGTRLLAQVAFFGFLCELIGAVVVGGYLLFFAKVNSVSILWNTFSFGEGVNYFPAFLASSVAAMFCYYGFEACGDVAEETPNAGSAIPKSMRMTIYIGGGAATFVCLALLLAVPNIDKAISGEDSDPVTTTLVSAMGMTGYRIVIIVVMISFLSCLLSLQAAASRLLFSFARDGMIFGSKYLNHLSKANKVPVNALVITGLIPILIASMGHWLQDAVTTIISFASAGIYIAFQMVVIAALYARYQGWKPSGSFTLGKLGVWINVLALFYGVTAVANMVWPRTPEEPWYINYGMIFTTFIVISTGMLYLLIKKPHLQRKIS